MVAIEARTVLPAGSWRDPAAYAPLAGMGPRGFAWEFLRRDPAYWDAWAAERTDAEPGEEPLPAASPAFVARWGLHFR